MVECGKCRKKCFGDWEALLKYEDMFTGSSMKKSVAREGLCFNVSFDLFVKTLCLPV